MRAQGLDRRTQTSLVSGFKKRPASPAWLNRTSRTLTPGRRLRDFRDNVLKRLANINAGLA